MNFLGRLGLDGRTLEKFFSFCHPKPFYPTFFTPISLVKVFALIWVEKIALLEYFNVSLVLWDIRDLFHSPSYQDWASRKEFSGYILCSTRPFLEGQARIPSWLSYSVSRQHSLGHHSPYIRRIMCPCQFSIMQSFLGIDRGSSWISIRIRDNSIENKACCAALLLS